MRAGQRAVGDGVVIDVLVAAPVPALDVLELLQLLGAQHLAAVVHVRVVPGERLRHPVVHADVEVGHDDDGRLQALGEVEGLRAHREAFRRVGGEQQHVLGVAVRGVGAGDDVGLLRARRHARRGAAALDVEQHHRHLGEVGEPQELAHQRDAGAGGGRERARAVPAAADGDADGRQLVLRLHDAEQPPPVLGDAQALGVALVGLGQRGRRRDRIPRAHGRAGVEGAEAGGVVAGHEDLALGAFRVAQADRQRAIEVLERVVAAQRDGLHVGRHQLLLALELVGDRALEDVQVHVEQGGERAHVDHVLEQLALARVLPLGGAHLGDRQAEDGDVLARPQARQRRIVEQPAARHDLGQVLLEGLRVHGDHQVDAVAPGEIAGLRHPHLVPGRQALDVGGKDVLRADGNAHAEQRLGENAVGARRARAVDGGELHHEVVDAAHLGIGLVSIERGQTPRHTPVEFEQARVRRGV